MAQSDRPRLLWVNQFAVTPDRGGGTRHFELARELARHDWNVDLCASDFSYQARSYDRRSDAHEREPVVETRDGVDIHWLHAAPYAANDWRRIRNWLSFARSLLRWGRGRPPVDAVIGSSPTLVAALAAERLARRWRVPFVLEVRDLWPESLRAVGIRRGPGYGVLWLIARYLYRRASRIVVLAEGARDHLERLGIPGSRIAFVPNGVEVEAFADVEPPARESFTVVYAGAHGPANGLDTVLDAAEALRSRPEIRFLLVGDGPAKDALVRSARARSLDRVEFHDPVPKEDLPRLFDAADAGLMVLRPAPLFRYGVSPNKLFDYMAASLPVVCNVPGEVASMVADAGAGEQAEPGSAGALAGAIERLADRPYEERRAMGRAGRAWVARTRSRQVLASRLDGVLRAVIER